MCSTCEFEYRFGIHLGTICQYQTEEENRQTALFHKYKIIIDINNAEKKTLGCCCEETISQSSLSDNGKYNITKYGIDSKPGVDVKGKTLHFCFVF